jgi:hypothetical protein
MNTKPADVRIHDIQYIGVVNFFPTLLHAVLPTFLRTFYTLCTSNKEGKDIRIFYYS